MGLSTTWSSEGAPAHSRGVRIVFRSSIRSLPTQAIPVYLDSALIPHLSAPTCALGRWRLAAAVGVEQGFCCFHMNPPILALIQFMRTKFL